MEFNLNFFLLQLGTFIVGMWLSSLIFLPYLKKWMQDRQKRIEDQLATAEKRQKESEALKADLEGKLKGLEQRSTEILQDARKEANQAKNDIVQSARKEAELFLADARTALENERKTALRTLQNEVGSLAVSIAEKIIRSSVDAKVHEKIVKESIQEMNAPKK